MPIITSCLFDNDFVKINKINSVDKIEELVLDVDIVALTLPLTEQSKGMINNELLAKAKRDVILVNTSRGLIVDQNCLIDSLKKGKIKAYLTDVLEEEPMIKNHPLLQFDNVMITPHIGSRTFESVQRQGMMAIDNLFKALNIS